EDLLAIVVGDADRAAQGVEPLHGPRSVAGDGVARARGSPGHSVLGGIRYRRFLPTATWSAVVPSPAWVASPVHWATNVAPRVSLARTEKRPLEATVASKCPHSERPSSLAKTVTRSPPAAPHSLPPTVTKPGLAIRFLAEIVRVDGVPASPPAVVSSRSPVPDASA